MRHLCKVLAEQNMPDGMGGHSKEWQEITQIWAEITLPTGRVAAIAQQATALVTAEVRCRPHAALIAGRRLDHKGTLYQIEAALPDNRNRMTRLLCSTVPYP